jgi:transposase-like protein
LPFAIWDLDSVGPFKTAPGGYKHILVAVDKFTNWIEVRPVATVTSKEAAKFIEDITHRFGVPSRIVTDLGKAFTGALFSLLEILLSTLSPPH